MRNGEGSWQRVNRRRPCPVCGRPTWCMYAGPADAPEAVLCQRVESPRRIGEAGWLHRVRESATAWPAGKRRIRAAVRMAEPVGGRLDFDKLASDFGAAVQPEALGRLAVALGLSVESLQRLGVGWSSQYRAWSFPMGAPAGNVLGIRLRLAGGRKLAVRGGREGLFLPEGLNCAERLLITEGPTDCAALLDLGFPAVGRPSCSGGVWLLVELVRQRRPAEVIVMADSDAPGHRGAESLAAVLVAYCAAVRVIAPPAGVKDARDWKRSGATTADVLAAIDAAPVRRLTVTTRRKGR